MRLYIQKNNKQDLASKISAASFIKNGFKKENIFFLDFEKNDLLKSMIGRKYKRSGVVKYFKNDLQSFTLLRFLAPQQDDYNGKLLVIDPDVFALKKVDNIFNLLSDQEDLACTYIGDKARTEVMLINAQKVKWEFQNIIKKVFNLELDYTDLMNLSFDKNLKIKKLDNSFNSLDVIKDETVLLHTTNRITQPWKEGLKVDFEIHKSKYYIIKQLVKKWVGKNYDNQVTNLRYFRHPNEQIIKTIKFFFNFAKKNGIITESDINNAVRNLEISKTFLKK